MNTLRSCVCVFCNYVNCSDRPTHEHVYKYTLNRIWNNNVLSNSLVQRFDALMNFELFWCNYCAIALLGEHQKKKKQNKTLFAYRIRNTTCFINWNIKMKNAKYKKSDRYANHRMIDHFKSDVFQPCERFLQSANFHFIDWIIRI